jgi:uncharacterized membrane protein YccC
MPAIFSLELILCSHPSGFYFYQGGIHSSNGILQEPESEEAAVAFMHILLGCLVGMSFYFIFLSQVRFFF